ncbi:MAG: hypothetical protein ACP5SD_00655 [Elusimicrobiales bacterium]
MKKILKLQMMKVKKCNSEIDLKVKSTASIMCSAESSKCEG